MKTVSYTIIAIVCSLLFVQVLCQTTTLTNNGGNGTQDNSSSTESPTTVSFHSTTDMTTNGSQTVFPTEMTPTGTQPVFTQETTSGAPDITGSTKNPTNTSLFTVETASVNPTIIVETTVKPIGTSGTIDTTSVHSKTTHSHPEKVKSGFSGLSLGIGIVVGITITILSMGIVYIYTKKSAYQRLQEKGSTPSINFLRDN